MLAVAALELAVGELVFAAIVVAGAGYARGFSGFGFSAVLVSAMSFIVEPVEVVPLAIAFEVIASLLLAPSVRHEVRWKPFWILLGAAIIGNPVGVLLLTRANEDLLRAAIFCVLLAIGLVSLVGHKARLAPTTGLLLVVGVVAGVVNGAAAMAGMVLVLALSFMAIAPTEMRATLIVYFFASDLFVLILLAADRSLDQTLLWRFAFGLPIMTVGILLGSRTFRQSSVASFRKATVLLLMTISVVGLMKLVFV